MENVKNAVSESVETDNQKKRSIPLFPVVGIGASAGGLNAFRDLFQNLPNDTGMAFVVVQHLSPERESSLTEILSRCTAMQVSEITDSTSVEPNRIYVIPPNRVLTLSSGLLKLKPRLDSRTPPRPIDLFLKSLAEDRGDCSIGIILSGTANDGTLGLQAIKEAGGITMAQDESAQYNGMPRSAIASGSVDLVLAPAQIARELGRISRTPYLKLTEVVRPNVMATEAAPVEGHEQALKQILALLRNKTKVDFSLYKFGTIQRRIVLHQRETMEDYLHLLRENASELQALYQDLLINVTSFFRDPEVFELLKQKVFPKLLDKRPVDDPIRIWVAGCSTGQEVYSIIMSYLEVAGDRNIPFKVFATDLDELALEQARSGIYPKSLVQDISPQRLRRFFLEVSGGYQITKAIRECCVFARHDVVNDPPFSRMDLISCRNLLIYLKPALQRKVIPTFHYGLNREGFLLLGGSESIGDYKELFSTLDKQSKLYVRKTGLGRAPLPVPHSQNEMKTGSHAIPDHPPLFSAKLNPEKEADHMLLDRYAPPGVLINADLEILQFRGEIDNYLKPAPGKPSHNLLKMARPGLLLPLRETVEKAMRDHVAVVREGVRLNRENGFQMVNLEVFPVRNLPASESCFLVLFHLIKETSLIPSTPPAPAAKSNTPSAVLEAENERLKKEAAEMKEYLQSVIERQDAANEELQAAGEELQSSNEELHSINEELETSKEELQATNEELTTVNEELANRNREYGRLNDDLNNFLNSVAIPLVMVGSDFRIRQLTPAAEKLLKIESADVGRSLHDFRLILDFPELERLITEAMENISPTEKELQDHAGRWYLLRIRPYITVDRKIEGAVLAFLDVDALKRSELLIKQARDYAESILRTAPTSLLVLDGDLKVRTANEPFYNTFKTTPAETEGHYFYDLGNGQWDIPKLREMLERILAENSAVEDFEMTHEFEGIGQCSMLVNARIMGKKGNPSSTIIVGIQDITALKQAQEELEHFSYTITHDMRAPLRAMRGYGEILLRQKESLSPEHRDYLERIAASAERMDQLILDALNYSKLVRQEIEVTPVDCDSLLMGMLDSYPHFKETKGTITVDGTMPVVMGNAAALTQCFSNLLNNALKFTKPGQPPEVRIWAEDKGERVRIWVEDKGIGIAKEAQERIFIMFQKLSPEGEGTGIGLALVRKAAERMNGRVGVESELGKGSRFWLEFNKA